MLDSYIDNQKEEIISKLVDLIKFPSVEGIFLPGKPFGEECNNALEYMLALGKILGFKTKNVDGYCGYIEFGEGEELLGIIGHLDVVPAGEGWDFPPFSGEIHDDKIYGRGTMDDKGPVIASLYAMKAIMDTQKINKRVRLILGLNEETNWKCIERYKETEELPTIAFSPDGVFPCIYAEKGFLTLYLNEQIKQNQDIIIENIDCKSNPVNIVPRFCEVNLKVKNIENVITKIEDFIKNKKYSIVINKIDEEHLNIIAEGFSAHAAHPELGKNAISMMLELLNEIVNLNILKMFCNNIGMDYNGNVLGINNKDFSGELTLNVGNINLENDVLSIGLNLRVPVETSMDYVEEVFHEKLKGTNIKINITDRREGLNVSKDSKLVKTLCKVFNEKTLRNEEPFTMGGATYARAFKNCVSFGPAMNDEEDLCHQANEYISIERLILCTKIYAQAIAEL